MPCILTESDWRDFIKTLEILDMLIDSPETDILGRELLFGIRMKRMVWAMNMMNDCDAANIACPIPASECPLYALVQEKLKQKKDARTPFDDGPDGFSS
jgi:hypothetical protein